MMGKKISGGLFFGIGAILILLTLLGNFTNLGRYENKLVAGDRFDATLVSNINGIGELYGAAVARSDNWEQSPAKDRMTSLYGVVIDRFTHGSKAKYNPFSNWIMWFLGLFNHNAAYISDPDVLLKYGFSVMCHQSSWVLATLAKKENIPFRHVNLCGHVVMEAWWGDDWHLYDPSYEVIPIKGDVVYNVNDLENKPFLVKTYYGNRGDAVAPLFATKYNNSFVTDGMFIWKAEVLSLIERISNYAKWVLPFLMIIVGSFLFLLGPRNRS